MPKDCSDNYKDIKFLELAREISKESTAIQQKMASVIVKAGKVISIGINLKDKHAEARAIKPHMDYRGCDIYVSRWNGRISRPCDACQKKISKAGIRRAYYISLDGKMVQETFKEID